MLQELHGHDSKEAMLKIVLSICFDKDVEKYKSDEMVLPLSHCGPIMSMQRSAKKKKLHKTCPRECVASSFALAMLTV